MNKLRLRLLTPLVLAAGMTGVFALPASADLSSSDPSFQAAQRGGTDGPRQGDHQECDKGGRHGSDADWRYAGHHTPKH